MTSASIPAGWRVSDGPVPTVPLADVARSASAHGVSYQAMSAAARSGLLDVARVSGTGSARHITLESALLALAIAALYEALKIAFQTLLRAVRETGAKVTKGGLTIPLKVA